MILTADSTTIAGWVVALVVGLGGGVFAEWFRTRGELTRLREGIEQEKRNDRSETYRMYRLALDSLIDQTLIRGRPAARDSEVIEALSSVDFQRREVASCGTDEVIAAVDQMRGELNKLVASVGLHVAAGGGSGTHLRDKYPVHAIPISDAREKVLAAMRKDLGPSP